MHFGHMFPDMDQYIYFVYMPYFVDNQNLEYTLGDNQNMDHLDILVNMNKFHYYTKHLDHMVMDYKDHRILVLLLKRIWSLNVTFILFKKELSYEEVVVVGS